MAKPRRLPKIMHWTSRWLKSGETNPTPPWHVPEERADLPQSISKELHFGGFLTEAPLLRKIGEGFFCLFLSIYLLQLSWKEDVVLNPSPIAVSWEVFEVTRKTRPCSCRDRHPANKSSKVTRRGCGMPSGQARPAPSECPRQSDIPLTPALNISGFWGVCKPIWLKYQQFRE